MCIRDRSSSLPDSTAIVLFAGDARCIPDISVLLYVIPLQISTCNLVAVWNSGCNESDEPDLIMNYYENKKASDPVELADSIVKFAAKGFSSKVQEIIKKRVKYLEKEMSDAS